MPIKAWGLSRTVNATDGHSFDAPNLFFSDGSPFPSSRTANPTLTGVAQATTAGQGLFPTTLLHFLRPWRLMQEVGQRRSSCRGMAESDRPWPQFRGSRYETRFTCLSFLK
jgi:hypothetical protein